MQSEDRFDELVRFVVEQRWQYDFPLVRDTKLQGALSIWGDDAVEFILAYAERFEVDVSQFMLARYFRPEGDLIMELLKESCLKKERRKELTLGALERGIYAGRLDEDVIAQT
ncbi:MAG: DUF1493 family protein [Bacteroidetes bacterium]|nr:DUF1493 family protein [Bacteroidota bacterium]